MGVDLTEQAHPVDERSSLVARPPNVGRLPNIGLPKYLGKFLQGLNGFYSSIPRLTVAACKDFWVLFYMEAKLSYKVCGSFPAFCPL